MSSLKLYSLTKEAIKQIHTDALVFGYGEGEKKTPFNEVYNKAGLAFDAMFEDKEATDGQSK